MPLKEALDIVKYALHHAALVGRKKSPGKIIGKIESYNTDLKEGTIETKAIKSITFFSNDVLFAHGRGCYLHAGEQVEFVLDELDEGKYIATDVSAVGGDPVMGEDYRDPEWLLSKYLDAATAITDFEDRVAFDGGSAGDGRQGISGVIGAGDRVGGDRDNRDQYERRGGGSKLGFKPPPSVLERDRENVRNRVDERREEPRRGESRQQERSGSGALGFKPPPSVWDRDKRRQPETEPTRTS